VIPAPVVIAFLTALAASVVLVPAVRGLARAAGIYADPVADRWHTRPVPKLGGIAMAAALGVAIVSAGVAVPMWPLLLCASLMFALGVVDDLRPVGPTTKLVAQTLVAAVMLLVVPPVRIIGQPVVDLMLAFFWIVGITNAFNLLDNMDGLAAGVAAIAAAFFIPLLLLTGNPHLVALAAAMAALVGVTVGFLIYNFHPASIFMGDAGSHLLGGFVAGAAIVATPHMDFGLVPVATIPVIILLIPIFDTTFVTLMRRLAGRSAFTGGHDHLSHRLVALGIGERRAVLVIYALALVGGAVAIGLRLLTPAVAWGYVAVYFVALMAVGAYLGHIDSRRDRTELTPAPLPSEITNRYRVYEVALDAVVLGLALYVSFLIRFREPQFTQFLPYFTRALPLVVGLQLAALAMSGKYQQVWRTLGPMEIISIVRGSLVGVAVSVIGLLYFTRFEGYSRGVFAFDALIMPAMLIGERVALGALDHTLRKRRSTGRAALVYGAGRGGVLAVHELLQNHEMGLSPIGFIDDDLRKRRLRVEGLPVRGTIDDLPSLLTGGRIAAVVISIRDLDRATIVRISNLCREHQVDVHRMRFVLENVPEREFPSEVVRFPGA
jgi:UDP-GlcNAc:undecaprenyl-phosphate GlcNAc-1-phosphate transferase